MNLPKASETIDRYFSYNDFDKKRVAEMINDHTKRVLDYVEHEYRQESTGLTFYQIMKRTKSQLE